MLEKPDLPDGTIISCVRERYGIHATQIVFLPLGADVNTAVYRVVTDDATPYFLKLRRGHFDETTVAIPRFLGDRGISQVIPPIRTRTGRLWARVDTFAAILSPFIAGRDGFEAPLSDRQWIALGAALRGIHTADLPQSLRERIPTERYAADWRDRVRMFQAHAEDAAFSDPVAAELAAFLRARRDDISRIVGRAEALAAALRDRTLKQVLCHADIHAGNVLIGANDALYIVDWDTLVFAPKERDLMFVGGGVGGVWNGAQEAAWFSQGYGQMESDPMALAYYRYERIVEDIAAFCEQLLLTNEGGADRAMALQYFLSQFLPNNVVEIAYATDLLLRAG